MSKSRARTIAKSADFPPDTRLHAIAQSLRDIANNAPIQSAGTRTRLHALAAGIDDLTEALVEQLNPRPIPPPMLWTQRLPDAGRVG